MKPAVDPASEPAPRRFRVKLPDEVGILAVLGLLVLVITLFHPDFLSSASITSILRQAGIIAIVAFGMVFLVTMRDFDLSVGATFAVTIVVATLLIRDGWNPWLAAGVGILVGAALGALNGVLTELLQIPAIVLTLGTLSVYAGLALILAKGKSLGIDDNTTGFFSTVGGDLFGLPVSVWVMFAAGIALTIVYRLTRFGVMVRAIGANPPAARFSGIPVSRIRIEVLMLIGAMAGIAGALTLAFFGAADPTQGRSYELSVIAAVVIGGTPLSGGRGTILGALIGALIIQVIQSGLVFFGVRDYATTFATGALIVAALALDAVVRRRRARLA